MNARHFFTEQQLADLKARVLRGCALLDRRRPLWYTQIDLEVFDLRSGQRCICGQLAALSKSCQDTWYGDYLTVLGLEYGAGHGFVVPDTAAGKCIGEFRQQAWSYQENIWRREIKARRRAAAAKTKAAA